MLVGVSFPPLFGVGRKFPKTTTADCLYTPASFASNTLSHTWYFAGVSIFCAQHLTSLQLFSPLGFTFGLLSTAYMGWNILWAQTVFVCLKSFLCAPILLYGGGLVYVFEIFPMRARPFLYIVVWVFVLWFCLTGPYWLGLFSFHFLFFCWASSRKWIKKGGVKKQQQQSPLPPDVITVQRNVQKELRITNPN